MRALPPVDGKSVQVLSNENSAYLESFLSICRWDTGKERFEGLSFANLSEIQFVQEDMMVGGFGIALTGMQAAGRMLGASAHNIANAHTEGFKRLRSIPEEIGSGGVRVTLEQDQTTGPSFFIQDEDGLTLREGSNVDLAEEITNTLQASHLFQANAASLRTQNKVLGSLLDILE